MLVCFDCLENGLRGSLDLKRRIFQSARTAFEMREVATTEGGRAGAASVVGAGGVSSNVGALTISDAV
jgi:hypothetical protein